VAWVVPAFVAFNLGTAPAQAQIPPQASRPERLSWYGDPGAPNISGVWVRAEDQGKPVAGDPEGWLPWPPPLKGAFADVWKKRTVDAAAGKRTDDPVVSCQPPGLPRFITGDKGPLLLIQSHGRVTMFREGEGARRIYMDGRPLPAPRDTEPFPKGASIGRYEGQDLVLETVGVKDAPIDSTGVPHSNQLKVTERFHRLDGRTLQVVVNLVDPLALDRPMTTTVTYKAVTEPEWTLHEFICTPQTNYHPDRYVH
jgi:hypothetical protein